MPILFSNLNYNCSNLLDIRNLQEQVKKAFCYQKLFRTFTGLISCSSDFKILANSWLSASNFKVFLDHLEQKIFLTIGQNNFGNKIQFLTSNLSKIESSKIIKLFETIFHQFRTPKCRIFSFFDPTRVDVQNKIETRLKDSTLILKLGDFEEVQSFQKIVQKICRIN